MKNKIIEKTNIAKTATKAPIIEALKKYKLNPCVQFHIPGHKQGNAVLPELKELFGEDYLKVDSTDEFNNLGTLNPATGAIKEAQDLAAEAFNAEKSFFLLNGSTIGNLAIAMALLNEDDKVIIGRNAHRSIVTGLINTGAKPIWVMPEKKDDFNLWGEVKPQNIKNLLEQNPNTKAVWITSPTYEGFISDIKEISKICKQYDAYLIVDEAHGVLWNFNQSLPAPSMELGADVVVHSMHKTGGSFSQSSIMHVSKNSKINIDKLEHCLKLQHTTSPSMSLLASLDASRAFLESYEGKIKIQSAIENANYLKRKLSRLKGVNVMDFDNLDPMKIFITIDGFSGLRIESILEIEYKVEIESASDNGFLVLSNIGNTKNEMDYLYNCIKSIIKSGFSDITHLEKTKIMPMVEPTIIYKPKDAFQKETLRFETKDAVGKICAEIIAECPPGICVLQPGELITNEHLPYLTNYKTLSVIKD